MAEFKSISYAITASTENLEILRLLQALCPLIRDEDELVIQIDSSADYVSVEDEISSFRLTQGSPLYDSPPSIKVIYFPLNNHFGNFKNNLREHCSKEYVFHIDADEVPSEDLIKNLPEILDSYPDTGLFHVPRVNTVDGITSEHIEKWGWTLNKQGWINWPDWQPRIFKNRPNITWMGAVHETITNYKTAAFFPELEEYSLAHPKTIEKQELQNNFYQSLLAEAQ